MRKFQIKADTVYMLYRTSAYAVLLLCGANILPAAYSYARFAANPAAHGILMLPLLFFAAFALWRHGLNRKLYTALHAQTPLAKRWLSSGICLWPPPWRCCC